MRIHRVEVKDSNGHFQKLEQKDYHDITTAMTELLSGTGLPIFYDIVGQSLMLYPAPASGYVTLANGLKIYVDRTVTDLSDSASATAPGFASPFHRILSYAAAVDYMQDPVQRNFLVAQKTRLEQGLVRFYGKRNIEKQTSIRPKGKRLWKQYT